MIPQTLKACPKTNLQRRKALQGAAALVVAGVAPAGFAGISGVSQAPVLSGKLICDIANPAKTLALTNHSGQPIALDQLSKSALMFDGSIVDCNNAFVAQPVVIPANQTVEIKFAKRHPSAVVHKVEDYQRVQSRVTRLPDGTRVIPFNARVQGNSATFI